MTTQDGVPSRWANLPISLRAVIAGLLITLAAVNVWPLLLLTLGVPLAAFAGGHCLTWRKTPATNCMQQTALCVAAIVHAWSDILVVTI
jgi:hypothetical protein